MTEQLLILQLREGNEKAFGYLVENYQDRVYNTCLGVLHNAEDAEDIAQEVFVEVHRAVQSFKAESKLSTWIYRICVTKSLDHLRGKKRKKRFAFVKSIFGEGDNGPRFEIPDYVHPGVQLENKERAAYLFKAIEELPENQRIAFTLNKIECLSYQEVSEITGMSVSAVESLLFRAKQNLKKILMDYYEENEIQ